MSRISLLWNQIGFKIFVASSLIPFAVVFVLGSIAYSYSIQTLTNNEHDKINALVSRTDELINDSILQWRYAFSNMSYELTSDDFSPDALQTWADQQVYPPHSQWAAWYLLTPDGMKYATQQRPEEWSAHHRSVYNETVDSARDLVPTGPYMKAQRGATMTISTSIVSTTGRIGVLAAELDLARLADELTKWNRDPDISMLLLNRELVPLVSQLKLHQQAYNSLRPELNEWLRSRPTASETIATEDSRYLAVKSAVGFQDWTLVYFTEEQHFLAKIRALQQGTLLFTLVFALVMLLYSYQLARYINKPIRMLVRQTQHIQRGNLQARVRLQRRDEFHTLNEAFNRMLDRIEALIEEKTRIEVQKKHFQLKALQYQINPHFLFNTLNSITSLLDLKRTEQIPVVITSLVRLFQHTLNKDKEWTTIAQELAALQQYVELQSIRYSGIFRVQYMIPQELYRYRILRMTLQPIVENAIFHGIQEDQAEPGLITVGGTLLEDGSLLLYVEDNGCGMPPEAVDKLLSPQDSPSQASEPRKRLSGFNSIGLRNVHERLQLHDGAAFGLRIRSELGKGTRVDIRYPAIFIEVGEEHTP
ncbi:sensor histidine kinase [Paenibacillus sp. YYML68]|uniref:sensor histidine kinase n=1 Tax=Paenibacillus sp. YYML68 TaxID=2909250 RepID=UPI002490A815|nr:histidine kinase [Paenibacillus sp. YYML68]